MNPGIHRPGGAGLGLTDDVPTRSARSTGRTWAGDQDWKTIQAEAVESSCRAEGNRIWVAVDRITELSIPLAEIGTGGDPGHAPARRLYERAGFTPVPLVRYFKALP